MCEVETLQGCFGYMCNDCQEDWNADRNRAARYDEALREIAANEAYCCKPFCPNVPALPRSAWCPRCIARAALAGGGE